MKQFLLSLSFLVFFTPALSAETPKIVALGDSLTEGYGLRSNQAYPMRLQEALHARGYDVEIVNAGVSGDTSAGGLTRLDWSVPDGTAGVILALGANDMLRGVEPEKTKMALDATIVRLSEREIPVMLMGMQSAPNMGPEYVAAFNAIYPDLAEAHDLVLVPFFLDGVAAETSLNQADGIHPTAEGVEVMVANTIDGVISFLDRLGITPQN